MKILKLGKSKSNYKIRLVAQFDSRFFGYRVEAYSISDSGWFNLKTFNEPLGIQEALILFDKSLNS